MRYLVSRVVLPQEQRDEMKNPPSKGDGPARKPGQGDVSPGTQERDDETFVVRDLSRPESREFCRRPGSLPE